MRKREIHDGVFIAVKKAVGELLSRLMRHAREMKFRRGIHALSKKAIKDGRRRRSIKAAVVKAQAHFVAFRHDPGTLNSKLDVQSPKRWMGRRGMSR